MFVCFQADTQVYDPKFHYSQHSAEKLSELLSEFKSIQSGYERNLLQHSARVHRLAVAYDEVMSRKEYFKAMIFFDFFPIRTLFLFLYE